MRWRLPELAPRSCGTASRRSSGDGGGCSPSRAELRVGQSIGVCAHYERDGPGLAGDGGGVSEAQEAQAAAAKAEGLLHVRPTPHCGRAIVWSGAASRTLSSTSAVSREQIVHRRRAALLRRHGSQRWKHSGLLLLGDWRACLERLRVALGSNPGRLGDMIGPADRGSAGHAAGPVGQGGGTPGAGGGAVQQSVGLLFYALEAVRAELAVATGDTERAFMVAQWQGSSANGPRPNLVERLIPLAARALADGRRRSRDRGEDSAPAVAQLDDLRSRYPTVVDESCARTDVQGSGPRHAGVVRRGGPARASMTQPPVQRGSAPHKPAPMPS